MKIPASVLHFFGLTLAWSWLCHLPRLALVLPGGLDFALGTLATFGPAVAALFLTYRQQGRAGLRLVWESIGRWRFPKRWWWPILLLLPASAGLTALIMAAFNLPVAWEQSPPLFLLTPLALALFLLNALPEEIGWRGYALAPLQAEAGPLFASLLLGLVWGLWHLPLHFIEGTTQFVIPVWQFTAQTILLSLLYTWLYNHTGGSILAAALFHTTGNLAGAFVPYWVSSAGRWINFAVLMLVALLVWAGRGLTAKT